MLDQELAIASVVASTGSGFGGTGFFGFDSGCTSGFGAGLAAGFVSGLASAFGTGVAGDLAAGFDAAVSGWA